MQASAIIRLSFDSTRALTILEVTKPTLLTTSGPERKHAIGAGVKRPHRAVSSCSQLLLEACIKVLTGSPNGACVNLASWVSIPY